MRRPGFTLIEVLTALVVVTAVMLLGITVGQRWVQSEREAAFMRRLETEWNSTVSKSETSGGQRLYKMDIMAENTTHEANNVVIYRNDVPVYKFALPTTIKRASVAEISTASSGFFTAPQSHYLNSELGSRYELTFEMGWGRLIIKKDGVPVD